MALQPEQMTAHYELGVALDQSGDLRAAASHFEIVAAKMPQFADARYSLGSVYARIDRIADAVTELRAAIELEPRHSREPATRQDPNPPEPCGAGGPLSANRGLCLPVL